MTKEVRFKGQLIMRRSYTDEEHKLTGGSFFIRQVRDEDLGIFFNPAFLDSFYDKNGIRRLKTSEFEECEAELVINVPDKFLEKKTE